MTRPLPILLILALFTSACGNSSGTTQEKSVFERVMEKREIRCGYVLYPPFMDRDITTGKVHGVVPAIWDEIGKRLELKITWAEETGWGTMIEGLRNKRYDAVCSQVWANAQRSKFTAFSKPVGYEYVSLYAHKDDTRFDHNIASANHAAIRFVTLDGDIAAAILKQHYPAAQIISLPQTASIADMLTYVQMKKADLAIVDPLLAHGFMKNNPDSLRLVQGGDVLQKFPVTFLLPQGDSSMKSMIDQTIDDLLRDGTIQKLMTDAGMPDQWLAD